MTWQTSWRTNAAFFAVLVLAALIVVASWRTSPVEWTPYSAPALAENLSNGHPTAVLYFARWSLSSDPKGRLDAPDIARALAASRIVAMTADLTDATDGTFQKLLKDGFVAMPVLVIYLTDGSSVGFPAGIPETQIVDAIQQLDS
jgi:thiol:disulfide interchange protein